MGEISESSTLEVPVEGISTLALTLIDSIPRDKKDVLAYKVMAYIADASVQRADESERMVPTKDIHTDLGNPKREPSAWLSPIWADINNKQFPKIEPSLIKKCRDQGFSHYPKIKKTGDDRAYYFIEASPIPAEPEDEFQTERRGFTNTTDSISYERDMSLKLSRLGRFIFGEGIAWTQKKRAGWIVWVAMLSVVAMLIALTGIASFTYIKTPLSIRDLFAVGMLAFILWKLFSHLDNVSSLFEKRLLLASDWMVRWNESGATVELLKPTDGENHKRIHICRYTAKCPCGGMVMLDDGKKDFPGRIVGRCNENPQEHIYSFDRVTGIGYSLRESAYFPPKVK